MTTRLLAVSLAAFLLGTAIASDQSNDDGIADESERILYAQNRREDRRDNRDDRRDDRQGDRDDRQECRQDEGVVGDDKRECKQENRGEGDDDEAEAEADA